MTDTEFQNLSKAQQQKIACQFFEVAPKKAEDLYMSISQLQTGMGISAPMCGDLTIDNKVPDVKLLLNALLTINMGDEPRYACRGNGYTLSARYFILSHFLLVLAATDPSPNLHDGNFVNPIEDINYSPDIKHWAQQGNWERRQYAALQKTVAQVGPKLQTYYIQNFHVTKQQAAIASQYYIDRLIWSYTDDTDASTTPLYLSACLETSDLDVYLKTDQLPTKRCPYVDKTVAPNTIILRRLLGLAIVNQYPTTVVKKLINAGAAMNVDINVDQTNFTATDTPLMLAAARPDVIVLLLKAGANPNSQNWFGKTALMYAVQEQDIKGVDLLIKGGADIQQATSPGSTSMGDGDPFEPISCSSIIAGSRTALMYAAWQGTPAIIKQLVAAHANLEAKDSQGQTAYGYLAKNGSLSVTERHEMEAILKPTLPVDNTQK